jgi:hypothetical protein
MRARGDRALLLRVALLAAAWSMSGAWSIAHALDHAHHGVAVPRIVETEVALAVCAPPGDAHRHAHPEILPAALSGKGSQPLAVAVLAIAPESPRAREIWQRVPRAVPPRAAPWTGGPSGPRAPPIA